jgi:hypothetical protein
MLATNACPYPECCSGVAAFGRVLKSIGTPIPLAIIPQQREICGLELPYSSQDSAISVFVTVIAPPILVAVEANAINCMRFAAVKLATSPVPPWPL